MNRCQTLIICLFFFVNIACNNAQKVVNVAYPVEGEIILTDGISVPKIEPGYTLWIPSGTETKGMIVFFHSRRDEKKKENIIRIAMKSGLAVMYATTDNSLEFFFKESKLKEVADYISKVCETFDIPSNNLLFTGMSLAGTRALKMGIFTSQEKEYEWIKPRAIAVCDAPLDMLRFHSSSKKAVEINFESISANEGLWVSSYLESNLGGIPIQNQARYNQYSPYTRSVRNGGNTPYFRDMHIRAYTEPDVEWWIENRRKDYYGMNAYDLAGFINQLLLLGSDVRN